MFVSLLKRYLCAFFQKPYTAVSTDLVNTPLCREERQIANLIIIIIQTEFEGK